MTTVTPNIDSYSDIKFTHEEFIDNNEVYFLDIKSLAKPARHLVMQMQI